MQSTVELLVSASKGIDKWLTQKKEAETAWVESNSNPSSTCDLSLNKKAFPDT